jgi:hypothetical protein
MRSSAVRFILDELTSGGVRSARETRPWGVMQEVAFGDLLIKVIRVDAGKRTSLQYHREKDEVIIVLDPRPSNDAGIEIGITGHVDDVAVEHMERVLPHRLRIRPMTLHRVTGPLEYLEVETNDWGRDTVRVSDDYGRG